jgi:hypothetical protein
MPHVDAALDQPAHLAVQDPLLLKTFAKEIHAETERLCAGYKISRERAELRATHGVLRVEAQMRAVHKNLSNFVPASSVGRRLSATPNSAKSSRLRP